MALLIRLARVLALFTASAITASVDAQPAPDAPITQKKPPANGGKSTRKSPEPDFKFVVEPQAMDLLKAASDKLASAKTMSFTATVSYEYPSKLGPPIVYTMRYDVTMQRPDKLRIVVPGDGPASEFYYDGKAMTAYAPAENLAAVSDAPPTIEAALKAAYRDAAIYYPFTDLLVADPYAALSGGAILAFRIGSSAEVGGTKTDMVAWANNDVFLQAWIGTEDRLPRRIRAVFQADPLRLRHDMQLSDWKLDPSVPPGIFVSQKAQAAGRMPFVSPAPPPHGVKPIVSGMAPNLPQPKSGQ
ncbi:DUF2092 domain-containing protein [Noviherbaspirillum pedocola]|uniref:DUF2092 domain-containing protein n=1 Tax=Noviherbaspirillum pedocola TaxID=2801341 RepID=A0A934W0J1_9BURK|nr:DUF2092 domain-containing protein [Noviherbaspirillum pedocola]MBK4734171.1 DUF2092 domain-containing protein [Noviherbaspirillum pedocola]